jgi:hypothetical protein
MTPEIERALRLNPRLRKQLRERTAALLVAVEAGTADGIQKAAVAWATIERDAERDLAAKRAEVPKHRVSFLLEETYYTDILRTAAEHKLSPSEVARRYCISGYTFANLIWSTVRRGGSVADWVTIPRTGPNLAQLALANFSGERAVGV